MTQSGLDPWFERTRRVPLQTSRARYATMMSDTDMRARAARAAIPSVFDLQGWWPLYT